MTCEEFDKLIHRKELSQKDRAALDQHAASCPACRVLADLRDLRPSDDMPLSAARKWREAVRLEGKAQAAPRRPSFSLTRATAAAACLVMLSAGVWLALRKKPDALLTGGQQVNEAPLLMARLTPDAAASPQAVGTPKPTSLPAVRATGLPTYKREDALFSNASADFALTEEAGLSAQADADAAFYAETGTYAEASFAVQASGALPAAPDAEETGITLSVSPGRFEDAMEQLERFVSEAGGSVVKKNLTPSAGETRAEYTLKLPAGKREALLTELARMDGAALSSPYVGDGFGETAADGQALVLIRLTIAPSAE